MAAGLEGYAERLLGELCASHPLGYVPPLLWKNLRVSAGVAHYRLKAISLSRVLLTDEERLRITLIHEYAHLLAVKRHGLKAGGHGPEWRAAMRELGIEPEVRHRYPVQRNAKRQRVVYRCLRCGTRLHRARRLPKRRKFVHAECGGDLRLEAVLRTVEAA